MLRLVLLALSVAGYAAAAPRLAPRARTIDVPVQAPSHAQVAVLNAQQKQVSSKQTGNRRTGRSITNSVDSYKILAIVGESQQKFQVVVDTSVASLRHR